MFPRLYADVVIASDPNSFEAKILARNYKKILNHVHERTHTMSHPKSCTHIKVTGVRCGSPALRGEQFCYFHQRMLRTVRVPDSRIRHTALLEDEASIQVSLMEVVNALLRGTIELKRAELILRALNTAVRNIKRVKFDHPLRRNGPRDSRLPHAAARRRRRSRRRRSHAPRRPRRIRPRNRRDLRPIQSRLGEVRPTRREECRNRNGHADERKWKKCDSS